MSYLITKKEYDELMDRVSQRMRDNGKSEEEIISYKCSWWNCNKERITYRYES